MRSAVAQPPFGRGRAKRSLYEGGVRVPLWISGPISRVPARGPVDGLAHAAVDVFATLLDLAGEPLPPNIDGVSLTPTLRDRARSVRETLYTDGHTGRPDELLEGAGEEAEVVGLTGAVPGFESLSAGPGPGPNEIGRHAGRAVDLVGHVLGRSCSDWIGVVR